MTLQEQWNLAQRLTKERDPTLYENLQKIRRKIMSSLDFDRHPGTCGTQFIPKPVNPQVLKWEDIEITPEVTLDPRLSFIPVRISTQTVKRLRRLLAEQRSLLKGDLLCPQG